MERKYKIRKAKQALAKAVSIQDVNKAYENLLEVTQ